MRLSAVRPARWVYARLVEIWYGFRSVDPAFHAYVLALAAILIAVFYVLPAPS